MYKIGVIQGDGIGPEVIVEALKVLDEISKKQNINYDLVQYPYCSQYYLDTGELMPSSVVEEMKKLDAVLLGAIGHPQVETGLVERSVISGLRQGLDLYINLRPIVLYADHLCPLKGKTTADIDMVVVRENTECIYTGLGGNFKKGTQDEIAIAEMVYTRKGVERSVRYAFDLARARNKKRQVTLVDKANAIRPQDLWTRVFEEVGGEYPDIERDHAYIDAACMWMIKNPEHFDVIVTPNLFGDIITDLGAMIQGGMGIAASGNINPGKTSMFEPIHGSAPKYAGLNKANPLGAILAVSMMLEHLGEHEGSLVIEKAVKELLISGRIPSVGTNSGLKTSEIGDLVLSEINRFS